MAKIKSTLDLVMEKTRSMSMSEEEKQFLRKKELTEKARGVVQKIIDDKMTPGEFKEIHAEGKRQGVNLTELVQAKLISRIDPEGQNDRVLRALKDLLGIDVDPFEKIRAEYAATISHQRKTHERHILAGLDRRGISGSSIIPNLSADEQWISFREAAKEEVLRALAGLTGV
ncbi:MAG: hypothetical protein RRA35_13960 [Desulfomonilia bacterium]|nr:hypothetical protein [Desulfomonilia bacterium]